MREWITRHPDVFGALLVALVASAALDLYRVGVAVGEARSLTIDLDRITSEALGG